MGPHLCSWFMGTALLATVITVTANPEKGIWGNNMLQDLHGDDFQTMTSFPFFPSMFAPTSAVVKNQLCRNDSLLFLNSLKNSTLWAVKMLDSSAKFPTGLFAGVTHNIGNYGECLSVKASIPSKESSGRSFIGKYCLAKFVIHPSKLPASMNDLWATVKHSVHTISEPPMNLLNWAICVPSTCSGEDLRSHLIHIIPKLDELKTLGIPVERVDVVVNNKMCSTIEDNTGLTRGQSAVICVMFTALILICLGSLVDCISGKVNLVPAGDFTEVLKCFSLPRNIKKLTSSYKPAAALGPIPGLKFLSMAIIIFGHRGLVDTQRASDNPRFLTEKYDDLDLSVVLSGNLVVDTFFVVTGYLISYHFILESGKIKSVWNILWVYLHRYIRLTPVYMFVVAFISTLYIKLGSGPEWNVSASYMSEGCEETWWINALYLNNIFRVENMCHRVSWYLAVDMQLFIVSVPLVYLIMKKAKVGLTILWILLLASLVIPFSIVYYRRLDPIVLSYANLQKDVGSYDTYNSLYIPTYTRATPYFIGILSGYFVHYFNNNSIKLSQLQANCMLIGAFILGFLPLLTSSMFYQQNYEYNALIAATYSSLHRLSWGTAISLGLLVFNAGKEWSVMKVLSWKVFVPLGKLTYSAYLVHVLPQFYDLFSSTTLGHLSWYNMVQKTVSDIFFGYLLAFVVSMAIEAPWMNMEKLLLSKYQSPAANGKSETAQSSDHKCSLMNDIEKPA